MFLNDSSLPTTIEEGLRQLCAADKYTMLGYDDTLVAAHAPCMILKIATPAITAYTGIELINNSSFVDSFNKM